MTVLNDRKPSIVETWVDDSGILRHFTLVQDPGKPLKLYLDGIEISIAKILPPS